LITKVAEIAYTGNDI